MPDYRTVTVHVTIETWRASIEARRDASDYTSQCCVCVLAQSISKATGVKSTVGKKWVGVYCAHFEGNIFDKFLQDLPGTPSLAAQWYDNNVSKYQLSEPNFDIEALIAKIPDALRDFTFDIYAPKLVDTAQTQELGVTV